MGGRESPHSHCRSQDCGRVNCVRGVCGCGRHTETVVEADQEESTGIQ